MPGQGEYLGDYFELWYGLFQSTVLGDMPFLNIDIQHKAFPKRYDDMTRLVVDVMENIRQRPNLNAQLDTYASEALRKHLSGLDIRYKMNDRGYESKFLSLVSPPGQYKFEKDGRQITIESYLRETYNYVIRYPQMPCIKMGNPQKPIVVPLELCSLSEKQVTSSYS